MSTKPVLFIPACEPGRGSGHIVRCMKMVNELRADGRDAFIYLTDNEKTKQLIRGMQFNSLWIIRENSGHTAPDWKCVVFDRFSTPPGDFFRWQGRAALIGIDEGGPCRAGFDFLIDILPGVKRYGRGAGAARCTPNISCPSLLPLPENKNKRTGMAPELPLKVLVSFGQEDSAGLGSAVAAALSRKNQSGIIDLTLLARSAPHSRFFKITESIPDLAEHLGDYDLLITHYGITAFESVYAGTAVVLVSPGAYHEKLAQAAGFFSVGIGKQKALKLVRILFANNKLNNSFLKKLTGRCAGLAVRHGLSEKSRQSLARLIDSYAPHVSRNCRVCGMPLQAGAAGRFNDRTYWRCGVCSAITMNRLNPPPVEYSQEYFFDFYRKQYGKTYIEDFPHLIAAAKQRLAVIGRLGKKKSKNRNRFNRSPRSLPPVPETPALLDIGCAYGPFLAAAQAAGFLPFGIDPCREAVQYVRRTLGLPAIQAFFPDLSIQEFNFYENSALFDVISLWYVIEHFDNCAGALAEIRNLLKPGGILAFSTPTLSGISGRSSLERFLYHSPADHWTIWSAGSCKKALKHAGFSVKKIISTGHHPERFPLLGKFAGSAKSPFYGILAAFSRIFALGDTCEVYAVRL